MIHRIRTAGAGGFSLMELIVVVAVIGILMALSLPMFLGYWRTATLKGGAQEMVALLNQARSLAIRQNTSVCVQSGANNPSYTTKIRYQIGTTTCTAASTCTVTGGVEPCIWTGAGTDGSGYITLSNRIESRSPGGFVGNPYVVFSYIGAASTAGTFTLRVIDNPSGTASVVVATSGRIRYQFP